VSSANWDGAAPPANVIRYSGEQFADSARYLAQKLGIVSVTPGPTEGADIAIILIGDVATGPAPSPTV
jgi:hypothetical protein